MYLSKKNCVIHMISHGFYILSSIKIQCNILIILILQKNVNLFIGKIFECSFLMLANKMYSPSHCL